MCKPPRVSRKRASMAGSMRWYDGFVLRRRIQVSGRSWDRETRPMWSARLPGRSRHELLRVVRRAVAVRLALRGWA